MEIIFLKHPKLGSGKIARRVVLQSQIPVPKRRQKKKATRKQKFERLMRTKQPIDKEIDFGHSGVKLAFQAWNSMGFPFVRHKTQKSKTVMRAINQLKRLLKKYETRQVIEAMELGNRFFQQPNFVFYYYFSKKKITLDSFIEYLPIELEIINKNQRRKIPASWMNECLQGHSHMLKNFSLVPKEKMPWITKKLTEAWVDYKRGNVNQLSPEFQMKMVGFSNHLVNFCKLNKMKPEYLADILYNSLVKWRTIKIKRLSYIFSKYFWSETIPEELLRYDPVGFKGRNFNADWKELSK